MLATSPTGADASRPGTTRRTVRSRGPTASSPVSRILVVDDDPDICDALQSYFEMEGYAVITVGDGETAYHQMNREPGFDLVLLDVVLPGMSGFDVLRESQSQGLTSPVLMMSARGSHEDILRGFGLGAQDYIVKPFDAEELVHRMRPMMGRAVGQGAPPAYFEIGEFVFDFAAGRVTRENQRVAFSEMEMDVLRCLVQNQGLVVTKKRLLRDAWHMDDDVIAYTINPEIAMETMDRSVRSIRSKIEADPRRPRHITSVYGLGYRFLP